MLTKKYLNIFLLNKTTIAYIGMPAIIDVNAQAGGKTTDTIKDRDVLTIEVNDPGPGINTLNFISCTTLL